MADAAAEEPPAAVEDDRSAPDEPQVISTDPAPPEAVEPEVSSLVADVLARAAALQFPEGLLMYACILADIFQTCAPCPVRSSHWR